MSSNGLDYYDVSLVDGYNLPVSITASGCSTAKCGVDLGPNCPAGLQGPYDSTGFPVGCKSDCLVSTNPSNSPSCCSGQYDTPATCPPSGVPHYSYFKNNCPDSYVYAYDESSGTALWTCSSAAEPNCAFVLTLLLDGLFTDTSCSSFRHRHFLPMSGYSWGWGVGGLSFSLVSLAKKDLGLI